MNNLNELLGSCEHMIERSEKQSSYQLLSDYFEHIRKLDDRLNADTYDRLNVDTYDRKRALEKNKTVQSLSAKLAVKMSAENISIIRSFCTHAEAP